MTKKDIHVVPHKDGWATKTEGATRAGVVVDTQRAAIERARARTGQAGACRSRHSPQGRHDPR